MTAHDQAAEAARRYRLVIEACERIAADPTETPERRALAMDWRDKLTDPLRDYGPMPMQIFNAAGYSHSTHGGGQYLHDEMAYDGWGDR
jgi:hypothetical protein